MDYVDRGICDWMMRDVFYETEVLVSDSEVREGY
jgi:hypothetical protein